VYTGTILFSGVTMTSPGPGNPPPVYRELQHFRQPLLWVLLLGLCGISLFMAITVISTGFSPGEPEISGPLAGVAGIAFGLVFPIFFAFLVLEVEVRTEGIRYRFFPLHSAYRTIAWDSLERYRVVSCRSTREYGGFGVRYKWKGYTCTVSGDRGLIFYLRDGSRLVIGSRNPGDFALAVAQASGIGPEE
jgi:hypothetical protein